MTDNIFMGSLDFHVIFSKTHTRLVGRCCSESRGWREGNAATGVTPQDTGTLHALR